MTEPREELDDSLERLGRATEGVVAGPAFSERVMAALPLGPAGVWTELGLAARRVIPALLFVSAVALVWAFVSERKSDELVASAETAELEW
ncbi:MAG: hypothetical protein R3B13_12310 [Polyangiaceae bacterium]